MSDKKDIYQILNELYKVYVAKDCSSFKNLLDEAEKIDSDNVYLVKYKNLYNELCWKNSSVNKKKINWKLIKYRWKTIKCPHCWAPLTESEYNKKVIEDFKAWKITVLKFKCEYCWSEFVWSYTGIKPLFLKDISVWKDYEINWEKYRVSWVVQYAGLWEEDGDRWELVYNEYILYDRNWDICRLSESESKWWNWTSYEIEREIELSKKVDFPYKIDDIAENYIKIESKTVYFKEKDKVVVKKIYWEVGKWYKIGENVRLYVFDRNWKEYVLEKEETSSNKEVGIYEIVYKKRGDFVEKNIGNDNLTSLEVKSFFKKDMDIATIFRNYQNVLVWSLVAVIISIGLCVLDGDYSLCDFYTLVIVFIIAFFYKLFEEDDKEKTYDGVSLLFILLFFIFLGWEIGYNMFYKSFHKESVICESSYYKKKNSDIIRLTTWTYKLVFSWNQPYIKRLLYTYDAWWKKYKYTYFNWFYFRLQNKEDIDLLKNFLNNFVMWNSIKLPLDKYWKIQVDLKDYKWTLVLQKWEFKNILGF